MFSFSFFIWLLVERSREKLICLCIRLRKGTVTVDQVFVEAALELPTVHVSVYPVCVIVRVALDRK